VWKSDDMFNCFGSVTARATDGHRRGQISCRSVVSSAHKCDAGKFRRKTKSKST